MDTSGTPTEQDSDFILMALQTETWQQWQTSSLQAKLVARGFEQKDDIDFFDPVVRWETIRILLAIAIHLNWLIHQLDVLTAFLNEILEEDVYMYRPLGFIQQRAEHLV